MRGTEKQIKWAEEIADRVIGTFERLRAERSEDANECAFLDNLIAAVKSADYAGDIIELFKDYKPNGDMNHDAMTLGAIYRVTIPATDGQKKILCK